MIPLLKRGAGFFSLELKVILGVFLLLLGLPLLGIITMANAGVSAISNALAFVNPVSHLIEIHNPKGELVKTFSASTTWPAQGVVTLEFGAADPPYQPSHTGIDIANKAGSPITPFMDGKVIKVEPNGDAMCGRYVEIDHGNNIMSLYCHMSQPETTVGAEVKPGDVIGLIGQTGAATGPHVHFQINVYGIPINPRTFVGGEPQKENVNK